MSQSVSDTVIQEKIKNLFAELGPVLYQVRHYTRRAEFLQSEIDRLQGFAGLGLQIAEAAQQQTPAPQAVEAAPAVAASVPVSRKVKAKAASAAKRAKAPAKAAAQPSKPRGRPKKVTPEAEVAAQSPTPPSKTNGAIERSAGSFL